jgi:hypothetical protein
MLKPLLVASVISPLFDLSVTCLSDKICSGILVEGFIFFLLKNDLFVQNNCGVCLAEKNPIHHLLMFLLVRKNAEEEIYLYPFSLVKYCEA